jgi:hypothetical protein
MKRKLSVSKSLDGAEVNLVVHLGRSGERQVTVAHVQASSESEDEGEGGASRPPRSKKPRYESAPNEAGSSSSGTDVMRDVETLPVRVVVVTERDLATEIAPDLEQARAEVTRLRRERACNSQYLAQVLPAYLVERFVNTHRLGMYEAAFDEDDIQTLHVRVAFDDQVVTLDADLLAEPAHWLPPVQTEEMIWNALVAAQPTGLGRFRDDQSRVAISAEHSAFLMLACLWLRSGHSPKAQFDQWLAESLGGGGPSSSAQ